MATELSEATLRAIVLCRLEVGRYMLTPRWSVLVRLERRPYQGIG